MIAYLSGLIIDKNEKSLTVLTGGIGYQVFGSTELIASAKIEQKIQLFIHTSVRKDDISLYGFLTKEEREFYQKLLTVSGIGPKMAMDILATPLALTKRAIVTQDIGLLTKIKGLGKKTAERLCLELKNKVDTLASPHSGSEKEVGHQQDAVLALESLGYERYQILKFMADLPLELKETEEIVKYFLKSS